MCVCVHVRGCVSVHVCAWMNMHGCACTCALKERVRDEILPTGTRHED